MYASWDRFTTVTLWRPDADGLLLIDQHVAHERILFEQRVRALLARDVLVQMLLTPLVVDLSPAQATAFDALESELEAAGFRTTRLAGRTVAVQGVPADLSAEDAKTLLTELLDAWCPSSRPSPASISCANWQPAWPAGRPSRST
jgi:DNA mismatch repair ATPase MutL